MDLGKFKVVELRAQLAARGLDQKGVKAVLVSRLQAALERDSLNTGTAAAVDTSVAATAAAPTSAYLPLEEDDSDAGNIPIDAGPECPQQTAIPTSAEDIEMYETPSIPAQQVPVQHESEDESDEASAQSDSDSAQYSNEKGSYEQSEPQANESPQSSTEDVDESIDAQPEQIQDDVESAEMVQLEQMETQAENQPAAYNYRTEVAEEPEPISADVEDSNLAPPSESDTKQDEDVEMRDNNEDGYEGNNDATLIVSDDIRTTKSAQNNVEDKSLGEDEGAAAATVAVASSKSSEQHDEKLSSKLSSEDGSERKSGSDRDNRKRKRSRSRSKSQTPPAKRAPRRSSPAQNIDDFTNDEDEPQFDEKAVLLSWYDSDLHLKISPTDLCSARPISEAALGLAWAGARSTYGVTSGKVCYEIQVNEINRVQNLSDERNLYELRCGWSVLSDSLQLGEAELSFGYSGCAKKCVNNEFKDYGVKYGSRGDVIGVYLDLESSPCVIEYTVNGESQGPAFEFNKEDLDGKALFPHVLSKNLAFTVNFGQREKLLVNEERPNRARRDESSRKDSTSRRDRESKREASPAEKEKSKDGDEEGEKESAKPAEASENKQEEAAPNDSNEADAEEKNAGENISEEKIVEEEKDGEEESEEKEVVTTTTTTAETDTETTAIVAASNGDDDNTAAAKDDETNDSKPAGNDEAKREEKKDDQKGKQQTLLPDYQLIGNLAEDQLVRGYVRPETRKECEVILLIGLPAAGKTHWAVNHSKQNVDKHYNLLGIQNLLDKMTVCGEPRKKHHKSGRWERFIDWTVRSLHLVQDIANKRRRNYILDQTNVLASAQRRKMKGFGDFKRIAVVVIPDDVTYKERQEKHSGDAKHNTSDYSLNEMKANFTLPSMEFGWFEEIIYTDLEGEIAKKKVQEFNEKGKKATKEHDQRDRGSTRHSDYRRDDHRDRYRDRRSSNWGGSDRRWRPQPPTSQWRGSSSSSSNYDRRDRWQSGGSSGGGGGGGGGGGSNWMQNNRRYDDRDRYERSRYGGSGGSGGSDRDRRDRGSSNRSERDFCDGNRERRTGGDNSRGGRDRGVPKKEKDDKSDGHNYSSRQGYNSSKSSGNSSSTQGHWNPNVAGASGGSGGHWNNFYSQQTTPSTNNWSATAGYTPQQQQWLQWQQQGPLMQHSQTSQTSNNSSNQWLNWPQQQQQQQQQTHQVQQSQQNQWLNWQQQQQQHK